MAFLEPHLTRAQQIVTGDHGDAPMAIPRGRFTIAPASLERLAAEAVERQVEVLLRPGAPVGGYQNSLDGRNIQETPLVFRVGYQLTGTGDAWDASGAASGAGTASAISARAEMDCKALLDALGAPEHWGGLSPAVIDCEPPTGPADVQEGDDRVIYELTFRLITRAGIPGSHSPSL